MARQLEPVTRRELADYLRDARAAAGLRQEDVAAALQIDASQVSRWERGAHLPSPKRFAELADILKIDIAELATRVMAASMEETSALTRENAKLLDGIGCLLDRIKESAEHYDRLISRLESAVEQIKKGERPD